MMHGLPPHRGAHLAAEHPHRPEESELPRALVDRERQRVADADGRDHDRQPEEAVDQVQHAGDLRDDVVAEAVLVEHLDAGNAGDRRLDVTPNGLEVGAVGEPDEEVLVDVLRRDRVEVGAGEDPVADQVGVVGDRLHRDVELASLRDAGDDVVADRQVVALGDGGVDDDPAVGEIVERALDHRRLEHLRQRRRVGAAQEGGGRVAVVVDDLAGAEAEAADRLHTWHRGHQLGGATGQAGEAGSEALVGLHDEVGTQPARHLVGDGRLGRLCEHRDEADERDARSAGRRRWPTCASGSGPRSPSPGGR